MFFIYYFSNYDLSNKLSFFFLTLRNRLKEYLPNEILKLESKNPQKKGETCSNQKNTIANNTSTTIIKTSATSLTETTKNSTEISLIDESNVVKRAKFTEETFSTTSLTEARPLSSKIAVTQVSNSQNNKDHSNKVTLLREESDLLLFDKNNTNNTVSSNITSPNLQITDKSNKRKHTINDESDDEKVINNEPKLKKSNNQSTVATTLTE
jgi:hypothetical protein